MIMSMLTTVDNPHNPFDNFKAWYTWDVASGYHCSNVLANILISSYELSEYEQNLANETAIDEIVEYNVSGVYRKVSKDFPD